MNPNSIHLLKGFPRSGMHSSLLNFFRNLIEISKLEFVSTVSSNTSIDYSGVIVQDKGPWALFPRGISWETVVGGKLFR